MQRIVLILTILSTLTLSRKADHSLNRIIENELPLGKILDWVDDEYAEPLEKLQSEYDRLVQELNELKGSDEVAVGQGFAWEQAVSNDPSDFGPEYTGDGQVRVPDRQCCSKHTVECLSCMAAMSMHQYCAQIPTPSACDSHEAMQDVKSGGDCECLDTWNFLGEVYYKCDARCPKDNKAWCYISKQSDCPDAQVSTVHNGAHWKYCESEEVAPKVEPVKEVKSIVPVDIIKADNSQDDSLSCKCKDDWEWRGETYQACDSRAPDDPRQRPWCYVMDSSCSQAKESHPNPGHYWRFCKSSESEPISPPKPVIAPPTKPVITPGCACETSWAYKGKNYAGCSEENPEDEKPWCMVPGPCDNAKKSKFEGGQMWRYCSLDETERSAPKKPPAVEVTKQAGSCECMTSWTWKEQVFTGCAPEHPDSKSPWCYIKGGLECGDGVKESKVKPGQFWKHCASAAPVVPASGGCGCMESWTWKEQVYTGCAPEHPDSKSPWCYIKGGLECGDDVKESKVKPGQFWKHCASAAPVVPAPAVPAAGACGCMESWTWKEQVYTGCAPEHPDSKSPWCYIKGGLECGPGVKESKVKPGQFWQHCAAKTAPASSNCECLSSWQWKEQTYQGCAPEHPDSKSPWCYIGGGLECGATVKESKVTPGMFWRHCTTTKPVVPAVPAPKASCDCKKSWSWKGQTFSGCAPEHPDSKAPWCYIDGDLECGAFVKESKVMPGQFWKHCGSGVPTVDAKSVVPAKPIKSDKPVIPATPSDQCKCKPTWTWKEETYTGCDPRGPDSKIGAWCYIEGGLDCLGAKESKVTPGLIWRHCNPTKANGPLTSKAPASPIPAEPTVSPKPEMKPITEPANSADCECMEKWTWREGEYSGCAPEHPDSKSPWCYIKGGMECGSGVKESKVTPGQFWKHCSASAAPVTPKGDCQCQATWTWKDKEYAACDPAHPDSKSPWCYIQGGLECGPGVKESKVSPGMFWKHCGETPAINEPGAKPAPAKSCECLDSWTWKEQTYTGCAPEHPDSKSPWCYIDGGLECGEGVKASKVTPGQFWKHCKSVTQPEPMPVDVKPAAPLEIKTSSAPLPTVAALPECRCSGQCVPEHPDEEKGWCYIQGGPECGDVMESKKTPGKYWRHCKGDDIPSPPPPASKPKPVVVEPSDPACKCQATWVWKKETYKGCDPRQPDGKTPWCYTGKTCSQAKPSKVKEGAFWRRCKPEQGPPASNSCYCQKTWTWKDQQYEGCDPAKPDAASPWCYINGDGSCPGAKESKEANGLFWMHCDVDGKVATTTTSPAPPTDAECQCNPSWTWKEETYEGCDERHPDSESPWCYISGPLTCPGAKASTKVPGKVWRHCTKPPPLMPAIPVVPEAEQEKCTCQSSWTWKDVEYKGCDERHPDSKAPWCYVKDTSCSVSKPSKVKPDATWRHCKNTAYKPSMDCSCQASWTWKSEKYEGCDPRKPESKTTWCYINGDDSCPGAQVSKHTEGGFWKHCGADAVIPTEPPKPGPEPSAAKDVPQEKACKCKASWVWKEQSYNGCDPRHPEAERNWCYINGDLTCPGAKASKDTEGMFWKRCTTTDEQIQEKTEANQCKCQSTWSWKKQTYNGCDPRHPDSKRPWCYVSGGKSCPDVKASKTVQDMFWKHCTLADEVPGTPLKPGVPATVATLTPVETSAPNPIASGVPQSKECKCQDTWVWKKKAYKGCDASHPDSDRPWCYINGGAECQDSQPSKDSEGMFWKRCSLKDEQMATVTANDNCKCQSTWSWKHKSFKGCDPTHPDAKRPWCYVNGGADCADAKPSKETPGMFWKRCTIADESPGTPNRPGVPVTVQTDEPAPTEPPPVVTVPVVQTVKVVETAAPANSDIPADKECKCKLTWVWKKETYSGCDARHPDAERNWCYINGGAECPDAKMSKDTSGMFWKRCTVPDVVPAKVQMEDECKCQSTWSWKNEMYKACDARHPDAERPWCYVNGGSECTDAKPSKDVPGMFWKRCTLADEAPGTPVKPGVPAVVAPAPGVEPGTQKEDPMVPAEKDCKCQITWTWKKQTYNGCDPAHPEAERNWCYINGGASCKGAKASKDSEGMFWKRCTPADNVEQKVLLEDHCKCQSTWKWNDKAYKGCDPSHPDAERPWCYIDGGDDCPDAKPSKDVPGVFWKRCTLADEAPGTPVQPGVPATVATKTPVSTTQLALTADPEEAAKTQGIPTDKDCKCMVSWVFEKQTYKGCDPKHPDAENNWCYINGGSECPDAKESEDVPGMWWKECTSTDVAPDTPAETDPSSADSGIPAKSECKCQSTWVFQKKTYKACDPAHPGADRPWCYINGGASCPGAKLSEDVKDAYWKRCVLADVEQGTPVNPDTPVIAPSKLLTTSSAPPAAQQIAHGGVCDCEDTWIWKKAKYNACDIRKPDSKHTWCYVKGPCANSRPSTNAPDKNWAYCDACDCKASWDYEGKSYMGCDAETDESKPWCVVSGGAQCKKAKALPNGEFKKECSRCECQTAWMFRKKTYMGCDNNSPGDTKPWCYVSGGDQCSSAEQPEGERKAPWRYCGSAAQTPFTHPLQEGDAPTTPKAGDTPPVTSDPDVPPAKDCKCKVTWVWEKKTYKGCDASHPDAERNWCYINGGASCPGAKESEDVAGIYWKRCTVEDNAPNTPGVSGDEKEKADQGVPADSECKCQSSWVFEKKTYKGCDPSHPDAERPWCYINGGTKCPGAKESEDVPGMYWKRCTITDMVPGTPVKPGTPSKVSSTTTTTTSLAPISSAASSAAPAPTSPSDPSIPADKNCKCKVSWVFEKQTYKGCDPNHPESKRNWCYINGGEECPGAKQSEDVPGIYWKRCTVGADELPKDSPDIEVPSQQDCKCQSTWVFEKKTYKGCDPSHPESERPWCYVNGGEECEAQGAEQSEDVKGMWWKRCTIADQAPGTPYKEGVPAVVAPKSTAASSAAPLQSEPAASSEAPATSAVAASSSAAPATSAAAASSSAAPESSISPSAKEPGTVAEETANPASSAAPSAKEPGTVAEGIAVGNDPWSDWGIKAD